MTPDLHGCLKTILADRFLAADPTPNGEVRLNERQAQMTATVVGLSPRTTTVRLDRIGHLGNLKQDTGLSIKKVCDYALIAEGKHACETTLVELKKTLADPADAFEQLRRSKPIIDYLLSVCAVELRRTWEHTVRYVLVAERESARLAKMGTRHQPRQEPHKDINVTVSVGFLPSSLTRAPTCERGCGNPTG